MSRVGKRIIIIPDGVKTQMSGGEITVEGPKGKLRQKCHPNVLIEIKNNEISVKVKSDSAFDKSIHGLTRSLISNMIKGVTEEFSKELEIIGVGFRAQAQNRVLNLKLGFSHPIDFPVPEGITIETPKPNQIKISGIDKHLVGQVAATIRSFYTPEPYKGKGIRYVGEYVRHKAGKAVA